MPVFKIITITKKRKNEEHRGSIALNKETVRGGFDGQDNENFSLVDGRGFLPRPFLPVIRLAY